MEGLLIIITFLFLLSYSGDFLRQRKQTEKLIEQNEKIIEILEDIKNRNS